MKSSDILDYVIKLRDRCDPEPQHSNRVAELALQFFDELAAVHSLGERERLLLNIGALLHDIGYAIDSNDGHHKNSQKMILECGIPGLSVKELLIVSDVARYHRKLLPAPSHYYFESLDAESQRVVNVLASFVRMADGLDRSHRNLVQRLDCVVTTDEVVVTVWHNGMLNNEIAYVNRKSDLFRKTFGKNIRFNAIMIEPRNAENICTPRS